MVIAFIRHVKNLHLGFVPILSIGLVQELGLKSLKDAPGSLVVGGLSQDLLVAVHEPVKGLVNIEGSPEFLFFFGLLKGIENVLHFLKSYYLID